MKDAIFSPSGYPPKKYGEPPKVFWKYYEVLILRDIIEPQIQKSSFTRLSEILTKAIYGTSTTQSVKEAFLEKVSGNFHCVTVLS